MHKDIKILVAKKQQLKTWNSAFLRILIRSHPTGSLALGRT
jgi:hypothetical protein